MIKSIKLSLVVSTLSLFLLACNEKSEAGSSDAMTQESAMQIAQAETEPSIIDDAMPTESEEATDEGSTDESGSTDEGMGIDSEMLDELQQQCEELATEEQVSDEDKTLFIEECIANRTSELNDDGGVEAEAEEAEAPSDEAEEPVKTE